MLVVSQKMYNLLILSDWVRNLWMREYGIMPDLFSNMNWSHGEICTTCMLTIHYVLGCAFMSCSSANSKPLCHCHLVCLHCDSGPSTVFWLNAILFIIGMHVFFMEKNAIIHVIVNWCIFAVYSITESIDSVYSCKDYYFCSGELLTIGITPDLIVGSKPFL